MPTTAEREFFVQKPREIYYETVEFYHPSGILRRFVADQFDGVNVAVSGELNLTLESNAPRNAGQSVPFEAISMGIKPVQQENGTTVDLETHFGRVGSMFKDELKKIQGSAYMQLVETIYRVYRETDLTRPFNQPITLFASTVSLEGEQVSILSEDDNPAGVAVADIYDEARFPGLRVQLG